MTFYEVGAIFFFRASVRYVRSAQEAPRQYRDTPKRGVGITKVAAPFVYRDAREIDESFSMKDNEVNASHSGRDCNRSIPSSDILVPPN